MKSPVPCVTPQAHVFVVDDDPAVLKGLARLLRSAGLTATTCSSAQEFLERHDPAMPGCLVLDVSMPGSSGLELQQTLAAQGLERAIVFLTGNGDIAMSVQAMKKGAVDFLTKPVNDVDLLKAVQSAIEKDRLQRSARNEVTEIRQRLGKLTERELEVMTHVISGRLNKQTADRLNISEKTVKAHRAHLMEKLEIQSVAELVRLAERAGMKGA